MNLQNDSDKLNNSLQKAFKNRDNKILPYLPQQMDDMAERTGAMQRKRGICSAVDLLRMLFLYAGSNAGSSAFAGMKNVLLANASIIRQDGKRQDQQRIRLCYSLNENKVSGRHTAESLSRFSMGKGELAMADAG